MKIPTPIRRGLRERLWALADQLDWTRLEWYEKSAYYEAWTRDPDIGELLSRYMDQQQVRVYIKDTVMKGYVRSRQADHMIALNALAIDPDVQVADRQERPHGRRLTDGRVIAWGNAEDWKLVLMAVFERSYQLCDAVPYGAVLLASVGRYSETSIRAMVENAAEKLGIERVVWLP